MMDALKTLLSVMRVVSFIPLIWIIICIMSIIQLNIITMIMFDKIYPIVEHNACQLLICQKHKHWNIYLVTKAK